MNRSATGWRPSPGLPWSSRCLLTLVACLALGGAMAADQGPRRHAEGQYDAASATYVVVEGDDLIAISERFGVAVADLKAENKLTSDAIEVGQKLAIRRVAPAAPTYKMTTPIAPGVAVPDRVETSIGTLNLHYGYPDDETTRKVYDNLDASRALQAYLLALPIVNQASMRASLKEYGSVNQTDVIWEDLVDSKTVELTANDNTVYSFIWLDTHEGPLVVEVPPKVLGLIDDFWYRWVADVGITGPDHGQGGKYLILPPGYTGAVPDGYYVVRPSTYGTWMPFRSFLVDGSPKPGVESVKANLKIYPLADAANPPEMKFVNASGIPANFVAPGDYTFWSLLNQVIQEEPAEGSDPTTLGLFASIGIEKGKPFEPDERMRKILTDAANIGAVTARAIAFRIRGKDAYFYPDSPWRLPFFGGYKFESAPGVANLDGAAFFYYFATGVTPAMAEKMVGKGSQYPWSAQDCRRQAVRRRQDLQAAPSAERSGQGLLVGDRLRQPDPLDDPDGSALPECQQPEQGPPGQRGRLRGRLVRSQGTRGKGEQLGADNPGQGLVHDPAPLWPAGALVRQELAAGGDRASAVSSQPST